MLTYGVPPEFRGGVFACDPSEIRAFLLAFFIGVDELTAAAANDESTVHRLLAPPPRGYCCRCSGFPRVKLTFFGVLVSTPRGV